MLNSKLLLKISGLSVLIFFLVCLFFIPRTQASNVKTVVVTFKTIPTYATATPTTLKYNKDFVFSINADDGFKDSYSIFYKTLNGGRIASSTTVSNGAYYTDGAGNKVPFRGNLQLSTMNTNIGESFQTVRNIGNTAYVDWNEATELANKGWDITNHGWSHNGFPDPVDRIFPYPEPHGPSTIDYDFEIEQNQIDIEANTGLRPIIMGQPDADPNYDPYVYNNHGIFAKVKKFSAANRYSIAGTNVTPTLDLNQFNIYGYVYISTYGETIGDNANDIKSFVDFIEDSSVGGNHYWNRLTLHRFYEDEGLNGMGAQSLTDIVNHIENNYGAKGADNAWVASSQEVYEYLYARQTLVINQALSGQTLTLTLDFGNYPEAFRRQAISLLVDSDAEILSVTTPDSGSNISFNSLTGLINTDWKFFNSNAFDSDVEVKVQGAESTRTQSSYDEANDYIAAMEAGSLKNSLRGRLDDVEIVGREWFTTFGVTMTSPNNTSRGKIWNGVNFIGATNKPLNEASGAASTLIYDLVSPFYAISSNGVVVVPADSGKYADNITKAYTYASGTAAQIKIRNLNPEKLYDVELFSSRTTAGTSTYFVIGSATSSAKTLNTFNNTSTTVIFSKVIPSASNDIQINIAAGSRISVVHLTERAASKPRIYGDISTTSLSHISKSHNILKIPYYLFQEDAENLDLDYEYSRTGEFGGEQVSMSAYTSDPEHSGVNFLASSLTGRGTSHNFIWNTQTDANNYEGDIYFRLRSKYSSKIGTYLYGSANVDYKAPILTNINATSTGPDLVKISWTSHEDASDRVNYGLDNSFGATTGELHASTTLKNHSLNLDNLNACSLYKYQVVSRDSEGNQASSNGDILFTDNCVGGAGYTASTTIDANLAATTTASLEELTVNLAPESFSGSKPYLQVLKLEDAPVLASTTAPQYYQAVAGSTFNINAFSSVDVPEHVLGATSTLTYNYNPSNTIGLTDSSLKIFYYNERAGWEPLDNCTVDTNAHTVTCETKHFSTFGVFGETIYQLVYQATVGGSVSGQTTQNVNSGANGTQVTAAPNEGYQFVKWSDNLLTLSRTENNVLSDLSFTAIFEVSSNNFTLDYVAGSGGTISGTARQTIVSGQNGSTVSAIADNGYIFIGWSDGLLNASRTDLNIVSNLNVTANFKVIVAGSSNINLPPSVGVGATDFSIPMNAGVDIGEVSSNGFNVFSYINSQAQFRAPESSHDWRLGTHHFKVINLNLFTNEVALLISSKPQTVTLKKGESREIDLDGDSKNDIKITFSSLYLNRTEITINTLDQVKVEAKPIVLATPVKPAVTAPVKTSRYIFNSNLSFRKSHKDVKELQKFLNKKGFVISKSGAGSPGHETTFFGQATRAALIKYQKANKISPAVGFFGQISRQSLNSK